MKVKGAFIFVQHMHYIVITSEHNNLTTPKKKKTSNNTNRKDDEVQAILNIISIEEENTTKTKGKKSSFNGGRHSRSKRLTLSFEELVFNGDAGMIRDMTQLMVVNSFYTITIIIIVIV